MKKLSYNISFVNVVIFTVIICAYLLLVNTFSGYSQVKFLQQLIAGTVYHIQTTLGMNVMLQDTFLVYPGVFRLNITLLCTGINEILMFSMILLGFIGVSLKTKIKGYIVFFPVIIMENIARISLIRPLASWLGTDTALVFHDLSFKYGQMMFIIVLVFFWFKYFAREEFIRVVRHYKQPKKLKLRKLIQTREH